MRTFVVGLSHIPAVPVVRSASNITWTSSAMISMPATSQVLSHVEPFAAPRPNAKHSPSKLRTLPLTVTLSEATLDAFRRRVLYPDTLAGVTE